MPELDAEKLKEYAKALFGSLGGAMTSAMVYLGDRLGIYHALAELGAASSPELAAHTGLHECWLREWLQQQGAAGLLEHRGDGRFAISREAVAVLADESHPAFGAGFFAQLPALVGVAERIGESFRTGLGHPYDALGPGGAMASSAGLRRPDLHQYGPALAGQFGRCVDFCQHVVTQVDRESSHQ